MWYRGDFPLNGFTTYKEAIYVSALSDFSTEWALWWITLTSNTMNRWYYLIKIVDN